MTRPRQRKGESDYEYWDRLKVYWQEGRHDAAHARKEIEALNDANDVVVALNALMDAVARYRARHGRDALLKLPRGRTLGSMLDQAIEALEQP